MGLITMLEIIIGWVIIFEILNYMIEDGLVQELRNIFDDIRRKMRL
jgi:hypothetical protein